MLLDRGDQAGSERAFERAARPGHLTAMWRRLNDLARAGSDVATQLRNREHLDRPAPEAAYRRVSEIGYDPDSWLKLGGLLRTTTIAPSAYATHIAQSAHHQAIGRS